MTVENIYRELGVSDQVYAYGERILASLKERFEAIDQVAEYKMCIRDSPTADGWITTAPASTSRTARQ